MNALKARKTRYLVGAIMVAAAAVGSGIATAGSSGHATRAIHAQPFASARAVAIARWQRTEAGNPDPATVANLRTRAAAAAAANGDPTASAATVIATDHDQAMAVDSNSSDGSGADPVQQVYYVLISGHFTGYGVSHPYGTPAPTGNAISLTIDAVTGEETDFSILKSAPDVASLGTPVTLTLR